jgi:acetyltransferase-like isoleucine patch superfamily enzyme
MIDETICNTETDKADTAKVGTTKADTAKARAALRDFLNGNERKLEIPIDSPVESRIRNIYSIIFPGSQKTRFYWRFFIARIASIIDYSPVKVMLYRSIGIKIGKGVFISPGVVLDPHFPNLIEIGDYVIIGWGTQVFTHDFSGNKYSVGRIKIERGVVIGGFCIIRGGVTIYENAQVPAACIVHKDVLQNSYIGSSVIPSRTFVDYRRGVEDNQTNI